MAGPHHRGAYVARARAVRAAANANPNTRCWRCGHTLDHHPNTKTGRPPRWTAGHVRDGDPTSPLLPEADVCNYAAGAHRTNELRANPRSCNWLA
jgi:hypothetical protein